MKKIKRFIVYEYVESLDHEIIVAEGTYEDVCKYIGCSKSSITYAFRNKQVDASFAVIKGYRIYKEIETE